MERISSLRRLLTGLPGVLLLLVGVGSEHPAAELQETASTAQETSQSPATRNSESPETEQVGQTAENLDEIRELLKDGRYPEAEDRARALLEEVEGTSGRDSIEAAEVVDALVEALVRGGMEPRAAARGTSVSVIAWTTGTGRSVAISASSPCKRGVHAG